VPVRSLLLSCLLLSGCALSHGEDDVTIEAAERQGLLLYCGGCNRYAMWVPAPDGCLFVTLNQCFGGGGSDGVAVDSEDYEVGLRWSELECAGVLEADAAFEAAQPLEDVSGHLHVEQVALSVHVSGELSVLVPGREAPLRFFIGTQRLSFLC